LRGRKPLLVFYSNDFEFFSASLVIVLLDLTPAHYFVRSCDKTFAESTKTRLFYVDQFYNATLTRIGVAHYLDHKYR